MSDEANAAEEARKKKLEEVTYAKELAEAEKARLAVEKAKLDTQKAMLELQKALEEARAPVHPRLKERQAKIDDAKAAKEERRRQKSRSRRDKGGGRSGQGTARHAARRAEGQVPGAGFALQGRGDARTWRLAGPRRRCSSLRRSGRSRRRSRRGTTSRSKAAALLVASARRDPPSATSSRSARSPPSSRGRLPTPRSCRRRRQKPRRTWHAPPQRKAALGVAAPVATAGLALEAVDKLLGLFRTDYTAGGVDVTTDDGMLGEPARRNAGEAGVGRHVAKDLQPGGGVRGLELEVDRHAHDPIARENARPGLCEVARQPGNRADGSCRQGDRS